MWHAPINGSQINPPAKLYKRFTNEDTLTILPIGEPIVYENNTYRSYCSIAWVEASEKQNSEYQPLSGNIVEDGYMTIKLHGYNKAQPKNIDEPANGDLIELDGELWIVEDGIQRVRIKSLIDFATLYVPLKKIL